MKKSLRAGVLFFILSVFGLLIVNSGVLASGYNVELAPAKVNLIVSPGETYVQRYLIRNHASEDKEFTLFVQDFTLSDEEGSLVFSDNGNEEGIDEKYSLKNWMKFPSEKISVPGNGETKEVEISIEVPEGAEAGGHYGVLFIQTADADRQDTNSTVGSVGRLGALVLLTVPGDVREEVLIENFGSEKSVYFNAFPEVNLNMDLKNNGNVHAIPTGAFFVSGGLSVGGNTVIFNEDKNAVLPDTPARIFDHSFVFEKDGMIPPMGKVTVDFIGKYGAGKAKNDLSGTIYFWLIPAKFLGVVLVVILVVIFVIYRVIKSYKKPVTTKEAGAEEVENQES